MKLLVVWAAKAILSHFILLLSPFSWIALLNNECQSQLNYIDFAHLIRPSLLHLHSCRSMDPSRMHPPPLQCCRGSWRLLKLFIFNAIPRSAHFCKSLESISSHPHFHLGCCWCISPIPFHCYPHQQQHHHHHHHHYRQQIKFGHIHPFGADYIIWYR